MFFEFSLDYQRLLLQYCLYKLKAIAPLTMIAMVALACGETTTEEKRLSSLEEKNAGGLQSEDVAVVDRKVISFSAEGIQELGLTEPNWSVDMEAKSSISTTVEAEKYLKIEGSLYFDGEQETTMRCVQISLKDNVNYREIAQLRLSTTGIRGDLYQEVSLPITVNLEESTSLPINPNFITLSHYNEDTVKKLSAQLCFDLDTKDAPAQTYAGDVIVEYVLPGEVEEEPIPPAIPECIENGKTIKAGQQISLAWENVDDSTSYKIVGIGDQSDNLGSITHDGVSEIIYTAPSAIAADKEISITASALGSEESMTGFCKVSLIADENIGMADDGEAQGFVGNVYKLDKNTRRLPDFSQMDPVSTIVTSNLDIPKRSWTKGFPGVDDLVEWFGIQFKGKIYAEKDGVYEFRVLADDGSNLYINGKKVVDNDGIHAVRTRKGKIELTKGWHNITVDYYQGPRYHIALQVSWKHNDDHKCLVIEPDEIKRPDPMMGQDKNL